MAKSSNKSSRSSKRGTRRSVPLTKRSLAKLGRSRASASRLALSRVGLMGSMGAMSLLDARRSVPLGPTVPLCPSTSLRTRTVLNLNNATAGRTVLILTEHRNGSSALPDPTNITSLIGVAGAHNGVPTSGTQYTDPTIAAIAARAAYGRLVKMTVTIQNVGSALTASGVGYIGTMPGNISRASFSTWDDLAGAIIPRREMSQFTAYQALNPIVRITAPQDVTEWNTNAILESVSSYSHDNVGTDSLLPIAIVLEPTTTNQDYVVQVHCEWRLVFTMADARSSLHVKTPTSSPGVVSAAMGHVRETGGDPDQGRLLMAPGFGTTPLAPDPGLGFTPSTTAGSLGRAARFARYGLAAANGLMAGDIGTRILFQ